MNKETLKSNDNKFDYRKSLKKNAAPSIVGKIKYIDIYLNRPVASLIVRAVFKTRITPNGLTYISFVLGLLGAFLFSRGTHLYFILGGVLAQMASIVDGADGMLARAQNMCSEYGSHLDLFLDRITDFLLIVGISLGAGAYFKDTRLLFLGTLAAGLYLLQINLYYLTKSYRQAKEKGETGEFRAVMIWLILIFAAVNRMDIFLYVGLTETVIVNMVHLVRFINLGRGGNKK